MPRARLGPPGAIHGRVVRRRGPRRLAGDEADALRAPLEREPDDDAGSPRSPPDGLLAAEPAPADPIALVVPPGCEPGCGAICVVTEPAEGGGGGGGNGDETVGVETVGVETDGVEVVTGSDGTEIGGGGGRVGSGSVVVVRVGGGGSSPTAALGTRAAAAKHATPIRIGFGSRLISRYYNRSRPRTVAGGPPPSRE